MLRMGMRCGLIGLLSGCALLANTGATSDAAPAGPCDNLGGASQSPIAYLAPGDTTTTNPFTVCTTRCEARVSIRWQGQPASGSISVSEQSHCKGIGGTGGSATVTFPGGPNTLTIPNFNAKNLCGENSPVTYDFKIRNTSDSPITNINTEISCSVD